MSDISEMRILFVSRDDFFDSPGGDTVQALKTKEFIEQKYPKTKIEIRRFSDIGIYCDFDIIHIFNMMLPYDALRFLKESKFATTAIFVLSTIYVDYSHFELINRVPFFLSPLFKVGDKHMIEFFKSWLKYALFIKKFPGFAYVLRGFSTSVRELIDKVDILLPNSNSEFQRLITDFGPITTQSKIVYNAVDLSMFNAASFEQSKCLKSGVVVVGRIEMRKNQLNVIKAVNSLKLPCKIIGHPALNQRRYYEQCLNEAGPTIEFLGQISQLELAKIYLSSKVSVLASWFETTGLVSLEAAQLGCNLVLTRNGDTYEYFGDEAFYCDPASVKSIELALDEAYNSDFRCHKLQRAIKDVYSWEHTADSTYQAYLDFVAAR